MRKITIIELAQFLAIDIRKVYDRARKMKMRIGAQSYRNPKVFSEDEIWKIANCFYPKMNKDSKLAIEYFLKNKTDKNIYDLKNA